MSSGHLLPCAPGQACTSFTHWLVWPALAPRAPLPLLCVPDQQPCLEEGTRSSGFGSWSRLAVTGAGLCLWDHSFVSEGTSGVLLPPQRC